MANQTTAGTWAAGVAERVLSRYSRERQRCGGRTDAMLHLRLAMMAELVVERWRERRADR